MKPQQAGGDFFDEVGREQMAASMAANRQPPIGETLAFALVGLERGHVVFEGSPSRKVFYIG